MLTKEYIDSISVSKADCYKMQRALYFLKRDGFELEDTSQLKSSLDILSLGTSLLSLAFTIPTVVGIVSTVAGLLSVMAPNFKENVEYCIQEGHDGLEALQYWFDDHPEVDKIQVRVSYLEFYDTFDNFRFIQHTSPNYIDAKFVNGVWYNA